MKTAASRPSMFSAAPDSPGATKAGQQAPMRRPASAGNIRGLLLITFTVVVSAVLAFPSFIILACGMPPALAAALIDNRPGHHASFCVMAANLAGVAPVLTALWLGGNSVALAMLLMSDVYVWLGMYGAAAFGWTLIWLCTHIAEFMLELMARYRIRKHQASQQEIVAEWGAAVAGETGDFDSDSRV